jgi:hypothetical protein
VLDRQQVIPISVAHEGGFQHQQVVAAADGLLQAGDHTFRTGPVAQQRIAQRSLTLHLHLQTIATHIVRLVSVAVVVYSYLRLVLLLPFQNVSQQTDVPETIHMIFIQLSILEFKQEDARWSVAREK